MSFPEKFQTLSETICSVQQLLLFSRQQKPIAWCDALGEDAENIHQTYVDNIGNLTLIRHNQELGQKLFVEKKKIYEENAGLQIAKTKITNQDHWDKDTISERMKWIIQYIITEVLPIPDAMRGRNNYATESHKGLSFMELQIIGEYINFKNDPMVKARVVSDKEVEFEGKTWRLSPLTAEVRRRNGTATASEAYQGAQYWEYEGMLLADLM